MVQKSLPNFRQIKGLFTVTTWGVIATSIFRIAQETVVWHLTLEFWKLRCSTNDINCKTPSVNEASRTGIFSYVRLHLHHPIRSYKSDLHIVWVFSMQNSIHPSWQWYSYFRIIPHLADGLQSYFILSRMSFYSSLKYFTAHINCVIVGQKVVINWWAFDCVIIRHVAECFHYRELFLVNFAT